MLKLDGTPNEVVISGSFDGKVTLDAPQTIFINAVGGDGIPGGNGGNGGGLLVKFGRFTFLDGGFGGK